MSDSIVERRLLNILIDVKAKFIVTIFLTEAIVVVQEAHLADIRSALEEQCEVKIKLDFVTIPAGEDWGTADSLRHIRDKIKVRLLK